MKVGIIGGGFGLRVQAPIIQAQEEMHLVAVCTMKRHQIPDELNDGLNSFVHYQDWRQMLDNESLDLLFVSSMPVHHYEMVKYALERRIHVVCEKPFTTNSQESAELIQLSKQYNKKVIIDFEWRYLPSRQRVKSLIQNNEIGELLHFEYHVSYSQYQNLVTNKRGWLGQKQQYGGMLGALGSHMIDCLRWLINAEVDIVNGLVHTHVPHGGGEERDADDAFFIHGKMTNNTTFSIQLLTGVNHGIGSSLKIYGNLGTVTLKNDDNLLIEKINQPIQEVVVHEQKNKYIELSDVASRYYPAFLPFLEKVYEYLTFEKLDEDLPLIDDGHKNQLVIDRVFAT
ncbi:Gfo/Idh/MocA family oxidoreductase [Cytobacillus sp. IB215665]|uniref:Gfo/Idh/MocA family protein n=1 Tax=Cytobacillus sp. IB215665 TaxID=3097357 RepID=UPI002A163E64|nr:Gfo/Idh/MocA family oxidoreductase [Cytobacillus sp. IB215665]MDX8365348.1 Gfo/Idh/MocA family oxidoreductase [Cytobacillus sp. IB215665]